MEPKIICCFCYRPIPAADAVSLNIRRLEPGYDRFELCVDFGCHLHCLQQRIHRKLLPHVTPSPLGPVIPRREQLREEYDDATFEPFILVNGRPPSLILDTGTYRHYLEFEDLGLESTGSEWDEVANWAIEKSETLQSEDFEFDSESGLFSAFLKEKNRLDALKALAREMAGIANDPKKLRKILKSLKSQGRISAR